MATTGQPTTAPRPRCRSWRSGICGCTSRAWAPTPTRTCRSSFAARAATSGTSRATATSTASPRCSARTSATAAPTSRSAGAEQAQRLDYFSTWSYAHPPAIELAAKVASLAPGDLNRVFFTTGGSEAVESALKLARAYHKLTGNPNKTKVDRARDRLPRHLARRALRDGHPGAAHAVRAAHARRLPRAQHERLPPARRRRPGVARRGGARPHPVRGAGDRRAP